MFETTTWTFRKKHRKKPGFPTKKDQKGLWGSWFFICSLVDGWIAALRGGTVPNGRGRERRGGSAAPSLATLHQKLLRASTVSDEHNTAKMDAIKKKMQAMKIEKDNALDRADAAEEKVRQITEKLERVEEELRDTQKKMMQTENDLDKAQEDLSTATTQLEEKEKKVQEFEVVWFSGDCAEDDEARMRTSRDNNIHTYMVLDRHIVEGRTAVFALPSSFEAVKHKHAPLELSASRILR
ncbi:unnamed protein product [Caenorhabditis auriculariae]|uniref:Tropomyosin n=1 Tax=Caenorhabditis auriculariae TaxID=2777116 RepID=A0A8S1GNG6_9PELO|nr:unnamed protein product [Caenorhabditis auriculariae]